MSLVETPQFTPKPLSQALLVGAASPLWGFFAGAAATGVAFWWMTRWTQPANLEAWFGGASSTTQTSPETAVALKAVEPWVAAVDATEAATETFVEAAKDAALQAEPIVDAAAEPIMDAMAAAPGAAQEAAEALAEPMTEAMAEAPLAAEAIIEAATPKPRKPKPAAEPEAEAAPPAE